jgi:hypothetical protein
MRINYFGIIKVLNMDKPTLIEPSIKNILNSTLKKCHTFRENYYNIVLNFSLGIGFFIILGLILLYKYKGKLTPKELEQKNREKHQYILSKIQLYQNERQDSITGLPRWNV